MTAYTRRQFLNRSLALISTLGTAPAFLSRSSLLLADTAALTAQRPGVPEDRVLVVVQLSGGNDGLNTVVPFGSDVYHNARPNIRVTAEQALVLDDRHGIGLHPSMRAIHEMVGHKRCAIVQGVGYPNPNRSHFASMDIWHAGVTLDDKAVRVPHGTGWIGRAMDASGSHDPLGCIAIGAEAPPATRGREVSPIAFERSDMFRWAIGERDKNLDAVYHQLQQAPDPGKAEVYDAAAFVYRTAMDAQVASAKVRAAVAKKNETQMPRTDLGRQLASVANMIRTELPTRVYYVGMGGFDTHAGQNGRQPNLLRDFANAVAAFYAELDATGHSSRVVTIAFSEFGRRVTQNASAGTDHGAAGPMFVFGDHLASGGGLVGEHPSLDTLDANGDVAFRTDFRSVYADVLANWMKLDPKAALGRMYKPVGVIKA